VNIQNRCASRHVDLLIYTVAADSFTQGILKHTRTRTHAGTSLPLFFTKPTRETMEYAIT